MIIKYIELRSERKKFQHLCSHQLFEFNDSFKLTGSNQNIQGNAYRFEISNDVDVLHFRLVTTSKSLRYFEL